MFKHNWVVFVVYKDYSFPENLVTKILTYSKVTRGKAVELAVEEVCFSTDDGIGFRSVVLVKPVKARSWSL